MGAGPLTMSYSKRHLACAIVVVFAILALICFDSRGTYLTPSIGGGSAALSKRGAHGLITHQPPDGPLGDKWIVLTSISYPTDVVKKLAGLDGWKVVMVADQKTPKDWQHENVTFLSVEDQQQLPYQIIKHIPWNSYGRKNIGYLYAIHHGAEIIYETDDDNELIVSTVLQLGPGVNGQPELTANITSKPAEGDYTVLDIPDNTTINFNPYPHFGVPGMWPRGLPLQSIKDPQPTCFKRAPGRPLIQQGLANNDPDVDAIYRLTLPLGVEFDRHTFSIVLPPNVMTPFNSQNTLFLYEALWALILPVTTTMRVCDIWRGYWAQRLLWDVGGELAFIPPTVIQNRNPHTMYHDFQEELPLYNQAGDLVQDLRKWVSNKDTLGERMVELTKFMADRGYWGHKDVLLVQAWVADLEAVKYRFPSTDGHYAIPTSKVAETDILANSNPTQPPDSYAFPRSWCRDSQTILVVNVNTVGNFLAGISEFLYAAYKPWFKEVFFTGEAPTGSFHHKFVQCSAHNKHSWKNLPGHFAQVCLSEVMSVVRKEGSAASYNVLYINDDVTFSPCMLQRFNHSRVWYDQAMVSSYEAAQQYYEHLREDIALSNKTVSAYALVFNVSHVLSNTAWHFSADFSNHRVPGGLAQHTHNALASAYGWMAEKVKGRLQDPDHDGQHIFGAGQADYFYVPARFVAAYETWARHMREHFIFSEVAVPNILGLLGDSPDDYEIVPGIALWGSSRGQVAGRVKDVLPLNMSMSLRAVCDALLSAIDANMWVEKIPPCWPGMQKPQSRVLDLNASPVDAGLFIVHPLKLSDNALRQHWLNWWQSQECTHA